MDECDRFAAILIKPDDASAGALGFRGIAWVPSGVAPGPGWVRVEAWQTHRRLLFEAPIDWSPA